MVSAEEENSIMAEIGNDRKVAITYLLNYHELLAQYHARKVAEIEDVPKVGGGGHGSLPGKPTEAKAIKSAAYDESHDEYKWLKAVEIAERTLPDRKMLFLQIRRVAEMHNKGSHDRGRPAWVPYTQAHYADEIEKRYGQSEKPPKDKVMRGWFNRIVDTVVLVWNKL